jgi:hypothetical protein
MAQRRQMIATVFIRIYSTIENVQMLPPAGTEASRSSPEKSE